LSVGRSLWWLLIAASSNSAPQTGYPTIYDLMYDLKGMGESNCAWNQNLNLTKDVLLAANSIYKHMYGVEENGLVGLPATYQILYFIGWKPDESQPKPKKRGSAQASLKDLSQKMH
jgi:NADH dehydrogenase [ubiquinone] 1 alpha subcomplex assembly factor 5